MRLGNGLPGQAGYFNWKTCLVDFQDGSMQTRLLPRHRQSSATLTQLLLPSCSNIGLSLSAVTSRPKAVLPKVQSPDQQYYHPLGTCQRCPFFGLMPDLMTQKLWEDGLGVCVLTNPPGVLRHFPIRTSGLGNRVIQDLFTCVWLVSNQIDFGQEKLKDVTLLAKARSQGRREQLYYEPPPLSLPSSSRNASGRLEVVNQTWICPHPEALFTLERKFGSIIYSVSVFENFLIFVGSQSVQSSERDRKQTVKPIK